MKPSILCIFIFTLLLSCKKETGRDHDNIAFTGKWELKYLSGGFAGGTIEPEEPMVLTLERNYHYTYYRNNVQEAEGQYYIDTLQDRHIIIHFDGDVILTQQHQLGGWLVTQKNRNQLSLYPHGWMDGFDYIFERKRK